MPIVGFICPTATGRELAAVTTVITSTNSTIGCIFIKKGGWLFINHLVESAVHTQ